MTSTADSRCMNTTSATYQLSKMPVITKKRSVWALISYPKTSPELRLWAQWTTRTRLKEHTCKSHKALLTASFLKLSMWLEGRFTITTELKFKPVKYLTKTPCPTWWTSNRAKPKWNQAKTLIRCTCLKPKVEQLTCIAECFLTSKQVMRPHLILSTWSMNKQMCLQTGRLW